MGAVSVVKLLISAVAPASMDLRDTVQYVILANPIPFGPWMTLDSYLFSLWQFITSTPIVPGQWWNTPPPAMSANLQLLSLLFRLPPFIFDLAIAIVLYFSVARQHSVGLGRLACLLWYVNPYTLFAVELLGVPDVAAAFFTLCAIIALVRGRTVIGSVSLALGIALKLYPILLLPPILIYLHRKIGTPISRRIIIVAAALVGLAAYVSWVFPSGVANLFLYEYSPVTQTLSLYIPYQPTGVRVSAATLFLVLLYFAIWRFANSSNITDFILPVFLTYFTFTLLYPQYVIWALPFLTLDIVLVKRRRVLLLGLLLTCCFAYWFIRSLAFLTPSGYSLLLFPLSGNNLPWYLQALNSFLKANAVGVVVLPVIEATLYGITFIYALEVIRGWFTTTLSNPELK